MNDEDKSLLHAAYLCLAMAVIIILCTLYDAMKGI